jgi:hypothetical protein
MEANKLDKAQRDEALALLKRLETDGLKFSGQSELGMLAKIIDLGSDRAKGWANFPIKKYLGFLEDGIGIAMKDLKKIDDGRYDKFKTMVKIYQEAPFNLPLEQALADAAQDALGTAAREQGILRYKLELLQAKAAALKAGAPK